MEAYDFSLAALLKQAGTSREDVADRLNVSVQTVHNWCRNRHPIAPRQLDLLAEGLAETGIDQATISEFVLSQLEFQGLSRQRLRSERDEVAMANSATTTPTAVIAVWRMAESSMLGTMASAGRLALETRGCRCLVVDCGDSHGFVQECVQHAIDSRVSGMILIVPGPLPHPHDALADIARQLSARDIPVVFGQFWTDPGRLPGLAGAVCWDTAAVGRVAVTILEQSGHQSVSAVFGGAGAVDHPTPRALTDEVRKRGMDLAYTLWRGNNPSFMEELRTALTASTAVLVDSPVGLMLLGNALSELGLRYPKDISILGFGIRNSALNFARRPFTVIEMPVTRLGQEAARLLAQMMKSRDLPQEERFVCLGENALLVQAASRGSVGSPRGTL